MKDNSGMLTAGLINKYKKTCGSDPMTRLARNAVAKTAITEIAMNRDVMPETEFTFSHIIKTGTITNQAGSGRCWMFAGLNTMRVRAMRKMGLEHFELSQSYTFFWDKLEKANYFLENIIETRDEHVYSRVVMWLLRNLFGDGGQWDMFANVIRRYGVVPKSVMPENFNTSNSHHANYLIMLKLRENAKILRGMHSKGESTAKLRKRKEEMMAEIYRMLTIFMGNPPEKFNWQYRDSKDKFHREPKPITPLEFYEKYVGVDLDEMVSLINCPTKDKPFNKTYTVRFLGNMVGGQTVRYLNLKIDTLKKIAADTVSAGDPVWFGCDVGKMLHREGGIMHSRMYDYEALLGVKFGMDKAERVDYGDSLMTHAMVFVGVDMVNGKPVKWMVENSWGDKSGEKGFFIMDDKWFDKYLYQVVISKKRLPKELQDKFKDEPVMLKPWDPMGSLAVMK